MPAGDAEFCGKLYAIYILKSYHRKGIGRGLTARVVEALQARGLDSMIIWVLKQNTSACRFYEALGGELVAEKQLVIGGEPYQAVAYGWHDLNQLLRLL